MQKIKEKLFPEKYRWMDKRIWGIALPCLIENLLTYSATLVTAAMIGRLATDAISAQNIGNRLSLLMIALFKGLGVGATLVAAVSYGARKKEECRRIIEQAMLTCTVLCVVIVLIMIAFYREFMLLFTNDDNILAIAGPYLKLSLWLCPPMAISRIVTAAFNAQGNTRTPMFISIAMNFVNALACYILIFGMGPIKAMGIMGAGWGLVISYTFSMLAGLFALYNKKSGLYKKVRRDKSLWHFDKSIIKVFTYGLPASFESMMYSISGIIISRALLSYSSATFAAFNLAGTAEEFFFAPADGFKIAIVTLVSQSIGANDEEAVKLYYRRIYVSAVLVVLPLAVLLFAFPGMWMQILTTDAEIQKIGIVYLMLAAIEYPAQVFNTIDFGLIRSVGYKNTPLLGTILGMWGVRVPMAVLAAWVFKADVWIVFAGLVFDQYARLLFSQTFIRVKKILKGNTKCIE